MATKKKLTKRIERRTAAGKSTKKATANLAKRKSANKTARAAKSSGRGIGKSGAAMNTAMGRLQMRSDRRAAAGLGTQRVAKSMALKEKLAGLKPGGKRATRVAGKIKSRAAAAKTRRTARKSAK